MTVPSAPESPRTWLSPRRATEGSQVYNGASSSSVLSLSPSCRGPPNAPSQTASVFLSLSSAPPLTFSAAEALLTAPGSIHETQTALVDGRLYNVYKNLWPSLREFWLAALAQYAHDTYIVYEDSRLSYGEVHDQALRVASLMRTA